MKSSKGRVVAIYLGGGRLLSKNYDVPARDLTEEEVKRAGGIRALIQSGYYSKAPIQKKAVAPIGQEDLSYDTRD